MRFKVETNTENKREKNQFKQSSIQITKQDINTHTNRKRQTNKQSN